MSTWHTYTKPSSSSSTLLYQRHPSKAFSPKHWLLSLSTVHVAYWTWFCYYVTDLTPNVHAAATIASTAATIMIDTTLGYLLYPLLVLFYIQQHLSAHKKYDWRNIKLMMELVALLHLLLHLRQYQLYKLEPIPYHSSYHPKQQLNIN